MASPDLSTAPVELPVKLWAAVLKQLCSITRWTDGELRLAASSCS